jgi:hypothetical protein
MRFGEGPRRNEKESHYMTSITDTPSRAVYTGGYLLSQCASRCFVDATPGNMLVPLAAARLRSMMSANEAVPSRPSPCAARAQLLHSGRTATPSRTLHERLCAPLLVHRRGRASSCRCGSPCPATSRFCKWRAESASRACWCRRQRSYSFACGKPSSRTGISLVSSLKHLKSTTGPSRTNCMPVAPPVPSVLCPFLSLTSWRLKTWEAFIKNRSEPHHWHACCLLPRPCVLPPQFLWLPAVSCWSRRPRSPQCLLYFAPIFSFAFFTMPRFSLWPSLLILSVPSC